MGMERIIRGILKYRSTHRQGMVEQFERVRDHPMPTAVFFTCMDSRMLPTRFTQTNVGDMFIIRNAGNLVPHSKLYGVEATTTEPAALEFGCVMNKIKHVVVCGHSDCKAMNLLYSFKESGASLKDLPVNSPIKAWLQRHGTASLTKFERLEMLGFQEPLPFTLENEVTAFIDPENKFSTTDKLSQVNTLQQLQHVASYSFMKPFLRSAQVHLHALWFDIYTGDIYYFSRKQKKFVNISEDNSEALLNEISEKCI